MLPGDIDVFGIEKSRDSELLLGRFKCQLQIVSVITGMQLGEVHDVRTLIVK
jgi:hypothetical protein